MTRPIMLMLLAAAMGCMASGPAAQTKQAVAIPFEDAAFWAPIGRVARGVDDPTTCTGVLIAPNRVLTVAHCVADLGDPEALAATELMFLAGAHSGTVAAIGVARRVDIHPLHISTVMNLLTLPNDLAVIHLSEPMNNVPPLPLFGGPQLDEPLSIVGYRNADIAQPFAITPCGVSRLQEGLALIDCPVVSGNSGAPLLALREGVLGVVGIMTARAQPGYSYAVVLRDWPQDPPRQD